VFVGWRSGIAELYIADISERMPRKLVTSITDIAFPSWSHDGKWIYFLAGEDKKEGVYRCPANGGGAVLLAAIPPGHGGNPLESFDGNTVYFPKTFFNTELEMVSIQRPGTISSIERNA
jgi:Tol biopolymer transport system component